MLLLEWLTSTTLTPPSPGEEGQQQELAFTAGGDAKAPQEHSWAVSHRTKQTPYDAAITILGIYPTELETVSTQKSVHKCLQQFHS